MFAMKKADELCETEPLTKEEEEEEEGGGGEKAWRLFPSCRLAVSFLLFWALLMGAQSQSNMGAAIVCITASSDSNSSNNDASSNGTDTFHWDKRTQGLIFSARFLAHYLAQLPTGHLTAYLSSRTMSTLGLVVMGTFDALTVPSARHSLALLCVVRAVQGIANALASTGSYNVMGKWFPRLETSLLTGFAGTGFFGGACFIFGFSAYACKNPNLGWTYIFYFSGGLSVVFSVVWYIFADDDPSLSRWAGEGEKKYVVACKRHEGFRGKVPWSAMARSGCVYAVACGQVASDWVAYLSMTVAPAYFTDVLRLSQQTTLMVCGVPYLLVVPVSVLLGRGLDLLRHRQLLTTLGARRLAQAIGSLCPATQCVLLAVLPVSATTAAIGAYVLLVLSLSCSLSGWLANISDLAPDLTGAVFTFSQALALWTSFVVPFFVDYFTVQSSKEQWNIVFYTTAGLQLLCFVGFCMLSSGDIQPWAKSEAEASRGAYEKLPACDTECDTGTG